MRRVVVRKDVLQSWYPPEEGDEDEEGEDEDEDEDGGDGAHDDLEERAATGPSGDVMYDAALADARRIRVGVCVLYMRSMFCMAVSRQSRMRLSEAGRFVLSKSERWDEMRRRQQRSDGCVLSGCAVTVDGCL